MELRVQPYSLPEAPIFNYEELKTALQEKMARYEVAVYTADKMAEAKTDRAALNKLKKALNDERIKREREYMKPFAEFKGQIAEIISIIDKPIAAIDAQVKEFEEIKKAEKMKQIEACWHEVLAADKVPSGVTFDHIFDPKWLNASVSMNTVEKAIAERIEQIDMDLSAVRALPAYAYEAEQVYLSTFNLAKALNEANRRATEEEQKKAYEAERAYRQAEQAAIRREVEHIRDAARESVRNAPPTEPMREWLSFKALLTVDEAAALGAFFKARNIQYEAI